MSPRVQCAQMSRHWKSTALKTEVHLVIRWKKKVFWTIKLLLQQKRALWVNSGLELNQQWPVGTCVQLAASICITNGTQGAEGRGGGASWHLSLEKETSSLHMHLGQSCIVYCGINETHGKDCKSAESLNFTKRALDLFLFYFIFCGGSAVWWNITDIFFFLRIMLFNILRQLTELK